MCEMASSCLCVVALAMASGSCRGKGNVSLQMRGKRKCVYVGPTGDETIYVTLAVYYTNRHLRTSSVLVPSCIWFKSVLYITCWCSRRPPGDTSQGSWELSSPKQMLGTEKTMTDSSEGSGHPHFATTAKSNTEDSSSLLHTFFLLTTMQSTKMLNLESL